MFLDSQLKGKSIEITMNFPIWLDQFVQNLLPSGLLWVAEHGWLNLGLQVSLFSEKVVL